MSRSETSISRRKFLRMTAAAGTAAGALTILAATAKGQGRTFKVGLIGCGGRGKGALAQNVAAGKTLGFNVQVVALAAFRAGRATLACRPASLTHCAV
jgi:myo-inositol 2-dehydrogenase/D-chiro-inositol 1-dehydrogenase